MRLVFLTSFIHIRGAGFFEPSRGTAPTAASAARQPFQRQNRFFNLFALKPKLSEHFVYIQNRHPPNGVVLC
jgi:hypothetical protein